MSKVPLQVWARLLESCALSLEGASTAHGTIGQSILSSR